jgi:hypothetical protein
VSFKRYKGVIYVIHNFYISVVFIALQHAVFLLKITSGADMVSIHNEEENAFILDTLQNHWKGPDDLLLGMFYDTDGK